MVDAREVLTVALALSDGSNSSSNASVPIEWEKSQEALDSLRKDIPEDAVLVITGFIASDTAGVPTTLGRNVATIARPFLVVCMSATSVAIWTDVDGVLSADRDAS